MRTAYRAAILAAIAFASPNLASPNGAGQPHQTASPTPVFQLPDQFCTSSLYSILSSHPTAPPELRDATAVIPKTVTDFCDLSSLLVNGSLHPPSALASALSAYVTSYASWRTWFNSTVSNIPGCPVPTTRSDFELPGRLCDASITSSGPASTGGSLIQPSATSSVTLVGNGTSSTGAPTSSSAPTSTSVQGDASNRVAAMGLALAGWVGVLALL